MDKSIDPTEYKELLEAIRFVYGYDFTDYAESTMKKRIAHFMSSKGIAAVDQMGKLILKDERMFEDFVQYMSITVTEMFRDPSFYKSLREIVRKQLATYPVIKIWMAGCATGQEAYSVAILLKEEELLERSLIYATDINQQSLHIAKQGIYALKGVKEYTQNYLEAGGRNEFSQYYTADSNSVLFDRALIQNIVFAPHNLATDKSFNEFQMIICRNVIMYFNQQLQDKVFGLFYESLCTFGFLGLGNKESLLLNRKENFEETDRKERIYRKIK